MVEDARALEPRPPVIAADRPDDVTSMTGLQTRVRVKSRCQTLASSGR